MIEICTFIEISGYIRITMLSNNLLDHSLARRTKNMTNYEISTELTIYTDAVLFPDAVAELYDYVNRYYPYSIVASTKARGASGSYAVRQFTISPSANQERVFAKLADIYDLRRKKQLDIPQEIIKKNYDKITFTEETEFMRELREEQGR